MDADSADLPLRATSPADRLWRWTVVDGNRAILAALLAVATFGAALAFGAAGVLPLDSPRTTQHILSRFVASTLPFVTIVAAANQIVLTMDLGSVGELRQKMRQMRDFREEVEDTVGTDVSPTHPADFLGELADQLVTCADGMRDACPDVDDVRSVSRTLASDAETLKAALAADEVTGFHAGTVLLNFDTGSHLVAVRDLRARDDLPAGVDEHLAATEGALQQTDVARQYFKTLHTEYELAALSRAILFTGLPAIVVGGLLSLSYTPLVAALQSRPATLLLLAVTVTLVFLPFLIMVAYMLRVAEIARQTADFGPFVSG